MFAFALGSPDFIYMGCHSNLAFQILVLEEIYGVDAQASLNLGQKVSVAGIVTWFLLLGDHHEAEGTGI